MCEKMAYCAAGRRRKEWRQEEQGPFLDLCSCRHECRPDVGVHGGGGGGCQSRENRTHSQADTGPFLGGKKERKIKCFDIFIPAASNPLRNKSKNKMPRHFFSGCEQPVRSAGQIGRKMYENIFSIVATRHRNTKGIHSFDIKLTTTTTTTTTATTTR